MVCIVAILSSLSIINTANAYDSLFIVENIKVDITAKNAVLAQERALDKAQSKAFMILARRMVEEGQNITAPDSITISSLVKDYEVTNEQLSAVRYVGTYTFRFREAAVSKFFSASGLNFTNESSKPLLVLPVLQSGGKNILWSEGNIWMQAWGRSDLSSGLVPVEVPIGDLSDISDINEDNALKYERRKLDKMLRRYNAKEAAIMIAVPDDKGELRISIYRTDRMSAQHVQDIIISSKNNETLEQIYDRAVKKSYSALQKDWKNKTISNAAQSQIFHIRAPLENIRQWVKINQSLLRISGVSDISVLSMRKIEAIISLKFGGDEKYLRDALSRVNLSLGQSHEYDNTVIYDLTYRNNRKAYQSIEPDSGSYTF